MRSVQRGITTTFIILIILGTAVALVFVYFTSFEYQKLKASQINTFEDCAAHYPVMESYPEQCQVPGGKHFTRQLTEGERSDRLVPPIQPSPSVQSSETANWKTYKNTKVGFEIKYPPYFEQPQIPGAVAAPADGSEDGISISFNDSNSADYSVLVFPYSGSIDELVNERNTAVAAFPTNKIPVLFPDKPVSLISESSIDGEIAQWYGTTRKRADGGTGVEIYFTHKDHGYIIRAGEYYPINQSLLKQLLSTFKFQI